MPWCFAFRSDGFHCGVDGTATLMAEHDNQAGAQNLDAVLDASQAFIVENVARYSNDEQISEPLIIDDFGRHTRIGTTEDDRKRVLTLRYFAAPLCRLTVMLHIAARIACIAFLELGDCLGGSYGRLFRVLRISGSGKLASANQTDRNQPRDKL